MSIPGKNVRRLRLSKGMTLKEVASLAGISLGLLGDIESGRSNPSLKTAEKLARVFGITLGQLVEEHKEDLPALDSWKQAKDFPDASLVIRNIQAAHKLSDEWLQATVLEAMAFFNWTLSAPNEERAAHVSGPGSQGGSRIFDK